MICCSSSSPCQGRKTGVQKEWKKTDGKQTAAANWYIQSPLSCTAHGLTSRKELVTMNSCGSFQAASCLQATVPQRCLCSDVGHPWATVPQGHPLGMEGLLPWTGLPCTSSRPSFSPCISSTISPRVSSPRVWCSFLNISMMGHCGLLWGPGIFGCHGQLYQLQSHLPSAQGSSWSPPTLALLKSPTCVQCGTPEVIRCSCMYWLSKWGAHLKGTVRSCTKWSGSHAWI